MQSRRSSCVIRWQQRLNSNIVIDLPCALSSRRRRTRSRCAATAPSSAYWVLLCFCVSCLMMRIEKAATYTNYYQHRRVPRQICGGKTLIGTNPNEFAKGFSFLLNAGDSSLICCCMGHRWAIEE